MLMSSASGSSVLAKRADLERVKQDLPRYQDFLLIDDNEFDAHVLKAVLHVWYGYTISVRSARSIGLGLDCLQENVPDIIFLDDVMPPSDSATDNIPFLRRWGYDGPIIVISGMLSRRRKLDLLAAGANDAIHKDDLSSVGLGELMTRLGRSQLSDADPTPAQESDGTHAPNS